MNPEIKNPGSIPSRKGVHFRDPSSKESKKSAGTRINTGASETKHAVKSKAPPTGKSTTKKVSVKADTTIKRIPPNSERSPKTGTRVPVAKKATASSVSPKKESSAKERELRAQLATEKKKNDLLKQEHRRKEIERLKADSAEIIKGVGVGAVFALIIGVAVFFLYYRSLSKYSYKSVSYDVNGYEYIDMQDTSEETKKKIEARQSGKEAAAISLKDKIIVRDNIPYVPYSAISEYFGLSIAGSNDSRTLIIGSSETEYSGDKTAVFRFDTNEIEVNGARQQLGAAAFMENDEFYIPLEFIECFVKGVSIEKKDDDKTMTVTIVKNIPEIYFGGSPNTPLPSPDISDYVDDSSTFYEYTLDLSKYNKYINPPDEDKYLTLVNYNNQLSPDYVPDDLTNVPTSSSRQTQQMRYDAAMSLTAFLSAAKAAGYGDITATSAYRSYSHQKSMYNTRLEINLKKYDTATAEAMTAESILPPGASEHQTGLCTDMHNMSTEMQSFADTEEYKWLIEHCADFGFILRYPQTKEAITGVKFEPWHFRFVGRVHAQKIMSGGLCLEEYLETYVPKEG